MGLVGHASVLTQQVGFLFCSTNRLDATGWQDGADVERARALGEHAGAVLRVCAAHGAARPPRASAGRPGSGQAGAHCRRVLPKS